MKDSAASTFMLAINTLFTIFTTEPKKRRVAEWLERSHNDQMIDSKTIMMTYQMYYSLGIRYYIDLQYHKY